MALRDQFAEHSLVEAGFPVPRELVAAVASTLREGRRAVLIGGRLSTRLVLRLAIGEVSVPVLRVELVGISGVGDVTNRVLQAAARELPGRWGNALSVLVKAFGDKISLDVDARTGHVIPTLSASGRHAENAAELLAAALEYLVELARGHGERICVVLEDVDELTAVASSGAIEHMARAIDAVKALGVVLVTGGSPPFGRDFARMDVPPSDPGSVADWIDRALRGEGVKPQDTGATIVRLCGSSLETVMQLARECLHGVRETGFARDEDVHLAFDRLVTASSAATRTLWRTLTAHQQNVMRATAFRATGLTTIASRERFSLGDTGTAHNSAQLLVRKGVLERFGRGYVFTDPFVRGWVIAHALPDVGLFLPITHLPTEREP